MKRFFLLATLLTILTSCSQSSYQFQNNCYRVYKIKPNNEFYEIYAKRGNEHFKIVSQDDSTITQGTKIKCGGCYKFKLKSNSELINEAFGVKMMPNLHVTEIQVSENTVINIDGGKIYELYYVDNLKGLYLVE